MIRRFLRTCFDIVLPARCLGCGEIVDVQGTLCASCWEAVAFLAPPWCARCGLPFELDMTEEGRKETTLCPECAQTPPLWRHARAVFRYAGVGKTLILKFKHGDRIDLVPPFGRWLAEAGRDMFTDADIIVPVPLHYRRLISRLYNQSALLATNLEKRTGVKAAVEVLQRVRHTPPQGHMGRTARKHNVSGAFRVKPGSAAWIKDKRIILIDDVMTTGATLNACVQVLVDEGVKSVDVLTIARVVLSG